MNQKLHEGLVTLDRLSLCDQARQIRITSGPRDAELLLLDAVTNPMKTRVDALPAFDLYTVIGKTNSTSIIGEDGVASCG